MRETLTRWRLRHRAVLLAVLAAYALGVAWMLLWPSGSPGTWTVVHTHEALMRLGLPEAISQRRVEFGLNVAMVTPAPFLAALLWTGWSWERWTAFAFVASVSIETFQGVLLPARSAAFSDVVANTLGALLGAAAAQALLRGAPTRVAETS